MDKKLFEQLNTLCKQVEKLTRISDRSKIPKVGGIYLIKNKHTNQVEYIGKALNLHRRINSDHISGENKISTSTFRRQLIKKKGVEIGKKLRQYVLDNYDFYVLEIDNFDMRSLMETLLIYRYRKINPDLLNEFKEVN